MADFYDITSWNEKPWYQTGGTRSKVIVENPSNRDIYFFKTSLKKEKIDYKYEFWSEIIASEIGTYLGFDLLKYDIAYKGNEIGCLSKSMIKEGVSKLTEGVGYLTGFDTTYNPEDKATKNKYSFQFILESLNFFQLNRFTNNIIDIIIFDSIIGNSDRHQENWGIITSYNEIISILEKIAKKDKKGFFDKQLFSFLAISSKTKNKELDEDAIKNLHLIMPGKFSQIYDSGSCLGREIDDKKIQQILSDDSMLESYIKKGLSEIHWEGKKLNHFELIRKIYQKHSGFINKRIDKIEKKYNEAKIKEIVNNIDIKLPSTYYIYKFPDERKELVIKMINLRINKLISLNK